MKATLIAIAAAIDVAGPGTASNGLADGGFDGQGTNVSTYCYLGASGCPSGVWSGSGALVHTNDPSWGAPVAQSPSTLFAVQGVLSVSQTFTASSSGNFRIVWYEADRPNGLGGQTYNISVGGTEIANSTSSTSSFVRKVSGVFAMTTGQSYTITLAGATTNGDHRAFIDSVDVFPANETASYNYDALGRLTTVTHSGAAGGGVTSNYMFDPADNRNNVNVTGAPR